jgi:hypothetical protein
VSHPSEPQLESRANRSSPLSNTRKAAYFYALALGLGIPLALLARAFPMVGLLQVAYAFVPLVAVLIMMLIVTRDGHSKEGRQVLGLRRLGLSRWGVAVAVPLLVLGFAYGDVTVYAASCERGDCRLARIPALADKSLDVISGGLMSDSANDRRQPDGSHVRPEARSSPSRARRGAWRGRLGRGRRPDGPHTRNRARWLIPRPHAT